jgi:hypothetical protein
LAAILGFVAIGAFAFQASAGALSNSGSSKSASLTLVSASSKVTGTGGGQDINAHVMPASSGPDSTPSAVSLPRSPSEDLALSGVDIMAIMMAALALAALAYIVLTFTRRRTSTG